MTGPGWVADPGIAWRILLTAELPDRVDAGGVTTRLAALNESQGWGPAPAPETGADLDALRAALTTARPTPVAVGVSDRHLVVSAHHRHVDGLGLLRVLSALTGGPVSSSARGVGHRPTTGSAVRTTLGRLAEVAFRPPARVIPSPGRAGAAGGGDVMVEREVAGRWRTADVVHAAARGVAAHQRALGGASRRVAIAVGATRGPAGGEEPIADHSVLLRLRGVERLDRGQIAALLGSAPVQTPPPAGRGGRLGAGLDLAARTGLRVLAPRLGSTVLASHLGEVTAPDVERLAFHPVTGGGSGLSLGAVGLAGRGTTVVTLRARGDRWHADGLERVLEAVVDAL